MYRMRKLLLPSALPSQDLAIFGYIKEHNVSVGILALKNASLVHDTNDCFRIKCPILPRINHIHQVDSMAMPLRRPYPPPHLPSQQSPP